MTTSSTSYTPGQIVLVEFVFTTLDRAKVRPAIILTGDEYHARRADAMMQPLTTSGRLIDGDYDLEDWTSAGLPRPSRAKGVIQTIHRQFIARSLGHLSQRDFEQIRQRLCAILRL